MALRIILDAEKKTFIKFSFAIIDVLGWSSVGISDGWKFSNIFWASARRSGSKIFIQWNLSVFLYSFYEFHLQFVLLDYDLPIIDNLNILFEEFIGFSFHWRFMKIEKRPVQMYTKWNKSFASLVIWGKVEGK